MSVVKPFLKWPGGKTNVLSQLRRFYPEGLESGKITQYIEPFLGGGVVLLDILSRYPQFQRSYGSVWVYDTNLDLINTWMVVKQDVGLLIDYALELSDSYLERDAEGRELMFGDVRLRFNEERFEFLEKRFRSWRYEEWLVRRAAQFLFLNKTCFNGLWRVNKAGEFNSPHARYKNPRIVDEDNLRLVSALIQNVFFEGLSFEEVTFSLTKHTFLYCDPPYIPLTKTASFASYAKEGFGLDEHVKLAAWLYELNERFDGRDYEPKFWIMESNANRRDVLDGLYEGWRFEIVRARRAIGQAHSDDKHVNEVLILNY